MWQLLRSAFFACLVLVSIAVGCNVQPTPPPVDLSQVELDADFASQIQSAPTVLVKFGATWCGPCVRLDNELTALSGSLNADAKIIKIDVDQDRELAATFQVGAIPHMILFKDGRAVDQKVGYRSANEVAQWMGQPFKPVASADKTLAPAAIQNNPFALAD